MKIEPSKELAYWVGVVQSDGYVDIFYDKNRKIIYHRISVMVSKKSLSMLEKFQSISNSLLGSKVKIYKCKNEVFKCTLGAKRLLKFLENLNVKITDPPIPPKWVWNDDSLLGAYLAGLIDGDGNINVRRSERKCSIEIFSHCKQLHLQKLIRSRLKCGVWIRRLGNCYGIGFRVSHKNYKFIENFILPYLTIIHKNEKLKIFINEKRPVYMGLTTEGIIYNLNRRLANEV